MSTSAFDTWNARNNSTKAFHRIITFEHAKNNTNRNIMELLSNLCVHTRHFTTFPSRSCVETQLNRLVLRYGGNLSSLPAEFFLLYHEKCDGRKHVFLCEISLIPPRLKYYCPTLLPTLVQASSNPQPQVSRSILYWSLQTEPLNVLWE